MNMPDNAMLTSPRGLREWYSFLKAHPDEIPVSVLMAVLTVPEFFIRLTSEAKRTFFDTRRFPWVARLEQNWPTIRHELDALLFKVDEIPNFQEVQLEQGLLTTDDKWKTYFFYVYGSRVERNCRECPVTARLIKTIPGMKTAMFSVLGAHKTLPPHRGPYKGVLRYHLALKVPEPRDRCGIRVGEEVRHWEEGRSLIFDDSHEHEAWNQTEETRVVLFVDILRPLPFPLSLFNHLVVWGISRTPFIVDALANLERWYRKVDKDPLPSPSSPS